MVLGVCSYVRLDMSNKRIRFAKTFSQKCLKILPRQRVSSVAIGPGLVLLPAIENVVLQKGRCEKYVFVAFGPSGLEIVFALLTEVIAFHEQIAIIEIRIVSDESPIQNILSRFYLSWSGSRLAIVLHLCLHELPEQIIGRCRR